MSIDRSHLERFASPSTDLRPEKSQTVIRYVDIQTVLHSRPNMTHCQPPRGNTPWGGQIRRRKVSIGRRAVNGVLTNVPAVRTRSFCSGSSLHQDESTMSTSPRATTSSIPWSSLSDCKAAQALPCASRDETVAIRSMAKHRHTTPQCFVALNQKSEMSGNARLSGFSTLPLVYDRVQCHDQTKP